MENGGEKKKTMSLKDGAIVNSYEELVKLTYGFFYQPNGSRNYSYNVHLFDCPMIMNIETGERYFGKDIEKFIKFPLHHIRFMPFTQEKMDNPQ